MYTYSYGFRQKAKADWYIFYFDYFDIFLYEWYNYYNVIIN